VGVPLPSYPEPNKAALRAQKMKKYTKLTIILLVILGISFFFVFLGLKSKKSHTANPGAVQEIKTTLSVDEGSGPKSFDISGFIGKTALDATQSGFKVVTNGTGVNAFITGIDKRMVNSKKHEFWQFDVNGSEAQVGAGSYIIQKGDSILWHINTY
jgi:cell division protein YceG involved in septum cleavage